jgi:hypothetical protein
VEGLLALETTYEVLETNNLGVTPDAVPVQADVKLIKLSPYTSDTVGVFDQVM